AERGLGVSRSIGGGSDLRGGSGKGVHVAGDEELGSAKIEIRPGRSGIVDPPPCSPGTCAIARIESLGVGFVGANSINGKREGRIELGREVLLRGRQRRVRLALDFAEPFLDSGLFERDRGPAS